MKLKYLGTAAAEGLPALFCECKQCVKARELGGKNIRTRSQALIDDRLLIDFPPDTYMHFILHNVPMNKIKNCLITHSHEDHLYADEIKLRNPGYSHLYEDNSPFVFYADDAAKNKLDAFILNGEKLRELSRVEKITPYIAFDVDGYTVHPLRASHDEKSDPLVYIIEKDGKSIFYANDTSELNEEAMTYLKNYAKPISLISLDCTAAGLDWEWFGHFSYERCKKVRDEFFKIGIADENTVFVLHHFSHNGPYSVYDDFTDIAKKDGFLVSYDGMEIEI